MKVKGKGISCRGEGKGEREEGIKDINPNISHLLD
jgi:hypothetical protein